MTRNSGRRNLPNNLSTLNSNNKQYDQFDAATKSIISMTIKQQPNDDDDDDDDKPSSESLERGRKKRFRYFVASLGLTVAAVNCYAQATFCIAIVEMVLPADYVFAGESGSHQAVKVVPTSLNSSNHGRTISIEPIIAAAAEELETFSCPLDYKYRDYYDEWRFPNESTSPAANRLSKPVPTTAATNSHVIDMSNRFDWDASRQGLLLGAFAMGMAPLQILGGRLAELYGAKWVLLAGCIGTALTNLTIPMLARFSYTLLVVNRIVMGIAQAGMEPGLMCLMAQWLAPAETGFFISMLLFALCIGFFLGSLLSSFLLTIGLGWALTYYVTGGLNLVVSLIWLLYASKGPEESGLITSEELAYIQYEQQQERAKAVNNDLATKEIHHQDKTAYCSNSDKQTDAPWMSILTTRSVWAFIICKISVRWCADVLTIELPTYLANVLHLSIKLNGILNSLSSAFFAIFSFITGYFVNELLKRTHEGAANERDRLPINGEQVTGNQMTTSRKTLMSKTTLRKLFQSVASFGSAIAIFLMTRYDCNIQLSMSMMFVLSACLMMGTGGELQIPYDMTSRYPGTLHGMACTLSVSGWLAPPLIGLILGDQPSSRHRWSIVWYLTAGINFIGGLVFVLFADASPRNFDKRAPRRKKAPGKTATHLQNGIHGSLAAPPPANNRQQQQQQHHQHHQQSRAALLQHKVDASPTCGGPSSNLVAAELTISPSEAAPTARSSRGCCSPVPRPSASCSSSVGFDGGELLKIRQPEGSLLFSSSSSSSSPGGRLDSMLVGQLTDVMFPYQQARDCTQTTNGLASGGGQSGLLAWLSVGKRRRRRRRQQSQRKQQLNANLVRQPKEASQESCKTDNSASSKTITRL